MGVKVIKSKHQTFVKENYSNDFLLVSVNNRYAKKSHVK